MATGVFVGVPESEEVKQAARVPVAEPLGPDRLELVAAQDNIIFMMVSRRSSPTAAQDTANVAAKASYRS